MKLKNLFDFVFVVPSEGSSGGLALLWNSSNKVEISSFSKGHIDAIIKDNSEWWRFAGFYGNPVVEKRKDSWTLLKRLFDNDPTHLPWLIGGDFNEILYSHEKEGGSEKMEA